MGTNRAVELDEHLPSVSKHGSVDKTTEKTA